ncbi:RNase H domain-containing protein [Trichonephila clavipes]|nr:RNase H domain-containing protein [Trichonephila clavipes]
MPEYMVHIFTARIITGLRNTCPRDIVHFEADLQPLSLRRRSCITKYYNKLRGLNSGNRTFAYFKKAGVITNTDGSREDYYRFGSGFCFKSQDHSLRIQSRNQDGCSVFRSELIVINEALGSFASLPNGKKIWILSDSRSAMQQLSNWQSVRDNFGVSVLSKLK